MNRSFFDAEAPNPWKNRASIPYPKRGAMILVAVMHAIASLTLVFFPNEYAAMIAFTILCAGALLIVRMPRGTVGLLVSAIIPVVLLRSFSIGALVLAIVVGTASGTMLLTATRKPWRAVILPAIAWTVAYVVTKDATLACVTLMLLPAVLLLTYATLTDQRRCTAICYALIGFLISILALFATCVSNAYGAFDRSVLHTFFEESRAWCVDMVMLAKDAAVKTIEDQLGAEGTQMIDLLQRTLTQDAVVTMVAMIYNILPAIVIAACGIVAFEAQSLLCGMYYTQGMRAVLTPNITSFTMSVVSAALYVISFVILMFASADSMFVAVVQNCYIILTPGLFLVGWASAGAQFRASRGGSRVVTIVLAVFVLTFSGFGALVALLSFVGAVMIILSHLGLMMIKRMQAKMGDQLPPDFEAMKRNFERNARQNGFGAPHDDQTEEKADAHREDSAEEKENPQEESQENPHEEPQENDGDDADDPKDGNT